MQLEPYKNTSLDDIENEQWLGIEGFEYIYQISNMGRVKSLAREVFRKKGSPMRKRARILKQTQAGRGNAVKVTLSNEGKLENRLITSLVWRAFFGERKENCAIYHDDNDFYNNRLDNLRERLIERESSSINHSVASSRYKGVRVKYGKYISSQIRIGGGKEITKSFKTEQEAAEWYDSMIIKYKLKRKGNFI